MKLFGVEITDPTQDDESQQKQKYSSSSNTSMAVLTAYSTAAASSHRNPLPKIHPHRVHPYRRNPNPNRRLRQNLVDQVSVELRLGNNDPWLIKKRITESDLNGLSRLLLPRKDVERYVLSEMSEEMIRQVKTKEGLPVKVVDDAIDDGKLELEMVFKYWASSSSYVLNRAWSNYAKTRKLNVRDQIGLYWDKQAVQIKITVLQRGEENIEKHDPHSRDDRNTRYLNS